MKRIALLAIIVAAGCGGGDGLGRAEFVAELDRICVDFNAKQRQVGGPESIPDVARFARELGDEYARAVERMRGLGDPPEEIADEVERFVDLVDRQRALLGELAAAAEYNADGRLEEIPAESAELDREADGIVEELGARSCTEDYPSW